MHRQIENKMEIWRVERVVSVRAHASCSKRIRIRIRMRVNRDENKEIPFACSLAALRARDFVLATWVSALPSATGSRSTIRSTRLRAARHSPLWCSMSLYID